jgi:hypothetical protein
VKDVVRLNSDGSNFVSIFDEAARCEWSQRGDDEKYRLTIRPGVHQRANLFTMYENLLPIPLPRATLDFVKIIFQNEVENPGSYRIYMAITAKDAPSVVTSFIFEWHDFDHVYLKLDGSGTHSDAR